MTLSQHEQSNLHFRWTVSENPSLQHKLSFCEIITQGSFQCQVWTHRTSFSWACSRSVCVLHNLVVSGPCPPGQDLDREYYCGPPLVNNSPFNSVCNSQTSSVKRASRCCLSLSQQMMFPLSKFHSQLSIIVTYCWNTVTTTQGNTHQPKISPVSPAAGLLTLNAKLFQYDHKTSAKMITVTFKRSKVSGRDSMSLLCV